MSKPLKKPTDTLALVLVLSDIIKTAALVLASVLVQWAQKKKELAERKQAAAESELKIHKDQSAVEDKYRDQEDTRILHDFLARRKSERGPLE